MRQTRIVATVGPASDSAAALRDLVDAGVDVFRLNYSYGSREEQHERVQRIRAAAREAGVEVAVIQDLCGPKIRVGVMQDGVADLVSGACAVITAQDVEGTAERFSVNYPSLAEDVKQGEVLLFDDGRLEAVVERVCGGEVSARVTRGGRLRSRKGMNLPATRISIPSVTDKDFRDLRSGIEAGVDYVALSFVRHPADLAPVRNELELAGSPAQVIAKIEKPEAIDNLEEIIAASDGILVARGDLGVEMDLARVPILQKRMSRQAIEQDKIVIVATQMLESMVVSSTPTRAEVSDVTNAILDGADAVMLSGETAVGAYPLEAVRMMNRIARQTEAYLAGGDGRWAWTRVNPVNPVLDGIGRAAFNLCEDISAAAIVAYSTSGGTAVFLSRNRPTAPVVVFTGREDTCRRMRLLRGVIPVLAPGIQNRDDLLAEAKQYLTTQKLAKRGDAIVAVAGKHFGQVGATNSIEAATLG